MSDRLVVALDDCYTTTPDGLPVRLLRGEVWRADDPLVKAMPDLFGAPPGVEQATSAPGERRGARRG